MTLQVTSLSLSYLICEMGPFSPHRFAVRMKCPAKSQVLSMESCAQCAREKISGRRGEKGLVVCVVVPCRGWSSVQPSRLEGGANRFAFLEDHSGAAAADWRGRAQR